MIELMGMNYTPGLSQTDTTILIANDFNTQKCKLALQWSLQVKSKDWLYSCYKEWSILL